MVTNALCHFLIFWKKKFTLYKKKVSTKKVFLKSKIKNIFFSFYLIDHLNLSKRYIFIFWTGEEA